MPRCHVGKVWTRAALLTGLILQIVPGLPSPVSADVQVQFQPGPGADFAARAGLELPALQQQMQTELQNLFQTYRLSDYLRAFGDAQSFTTRGMGVDYASNFKAVMVGISGNLSLNVEKGYLPEGTRTQPPAGGMAPNATVMAGVNLDVIGIAPICLYVNYFNRRGTIDDDFAADLSNFGVHAQLKLFGPKDSGLMDAVIQWGGLDITSGFERSNLGMTLKQGFRRNVPVGMVPQGGGSVSIDLNTTGQFRMNARTLSVPLELTTNFRLLYLLSLYGGMGFDWQLGGGSDMTIDLDGGMVGVTPAAGGQPAMRIDVGTVAIDATDSVDPSAGRLRWLLGAQLNVLIVRLFVQLNLATQDPVLASVALGLRLAF
jgi:hypothetical protein